MAYVRGSCPLRLLGQDADGPHPAGELARRGDVRLAAVDPARELACWVWAVGLMAEEA